jgi:threonine dehydratase
VTSLPTYADVLAAADRISPHVHRTPVVTCRAIDTRLGATVFAKAENLQRVGAFKARGALNAVLSLSTDQRAAGVATHSSGNHGQAVALAAAVVGARAVIVMPDHASPVKVEAIRDYGADIVFAPQSEREHVLDRLVADRGYTVVHPFDDADVIAGQGTAALELLSDVPDLDVVVAPIGGGGLLSGTSLVAAEHGIDVLGAEPEVVDDAARSLAHGVRYGPTGALSVGDGLLTGIGALAFAILSDAQVEILTVSESEILEATRFVITRSKYLIEPSSGTAFAALFANRDRFRDERIGVIISGGNVDLATLSGRD